MEMGDERCEQAFQFYVQDHVDESRTLRYKESNGAVTIQLATILTELD